MTIQGQSLTLAYASYMDVQTAPSARVAQAPTSAPRVALTPSVTPSAAPGAAAQTPLALAAQAITNAGAGQDLLNISPEASSMLNRHLDAMGGASGTCTTCATRAYVCSDGGVSRPSPGNAAAYVVAHERAHLADDRADAQADGNRVVAQNIAIFTATCPECGVIYVSGGEASSLIASEGTAGDDHHLLEVIEQGCGADGSCCGCGCCGSSS